MARLDDMVHRIVRTEFASGIVDDPPRGRVVDPFARRRHRADDRRAGFGAAEERRQPASAECRGGQIHRA